jgi:hypothetical protein
MAVYNLSHFLEVEFWKRNKLIKANPTERPLENKFLQLFFCSSLEILCVTVWTKERNSLWKSRRNVAI